MQYAKPSMKDYWKYCPYCGKSINQNQIIPINGCANQCLEVNK